jgi:hypothetical protein
VKQVRPGQAKPEHRLGHKKSVVRDEALVGGYASGPAGECGKLYIYGYLNRIQSSRRLEREPVIRFPAVYGAKKVTN